MRSATCCAACEGDAPLSALYHREKTIKRQPGGVSIRTGFTLATRPFSVPSPFPCIPCFFFPSRPQPSGAGPPDPLPSRVPFACPALVAPFPPPSACVVCSLQDLWWVPLPGPRAPRYPCLSPSWSPVVVGTVLRCYDFFCFAPPAVPCLPFCSVPFPRRPLALCRTPS